MTNFYLPTFVGVFYFRMQFCSLVKATFLYYLRNIDLEINKSDIYETLM